MIRLGFELDVHFGLGLVMVRYKVGFRLGLRWVEPTNA